jgi:hypothetical protein
MRSHAVVCGTADARVVSRIMNGFVSLSPSRLQCEAAPGTSSTGRCAARQSRPPVGRKLKCKSQWCETRTHTHD